MNDLRPKTGQPHEPVVPGVGSDPPTTTVPKAPVERGPQPRGTEPVGAPSDNKDPKGPMRISTQLKS